MGVTAKSLVNGVILTNSTATYYTAPALTKCKITEIVLTNTHSAAVTVGIYAVPSAGTAAAANQLFVSSSPDGLVLAIGETKIISMNTIIEAGGFLQMLASANAVVGCRASGYEIV
jgi:hypothetical protein